MYYHFKVHKDKKGYWAECIELKGCHTQADTKEELLKNMQEVLNLYLDEPENSKIVFPLPELSTKSKNCVEVPVDPRIAFAQILRMLRIRKGITQHDAAKTLGMKNIYSYQRLESSRMVNPNLKTLIKIKRIFPEFDINNVFSGFPIE
jgi:antitoxin HicB